jgi:hypothetical protein
LEFGAELTVGREFAMFGPVVPELAAGLLFASSCVIDAAGGGGTRVAGASTFAAMTVRFAFLVA